MIGGGCRCGAVRYTLALDALPRSYACHCHQCQRWSGSAFSQNVMLPEDVLAIRGEIVEHRLATGDRVSRQRFCAACGTRLYNGNTRRPGVIVVRAGTLDRSEELACVAHIFVATRQRWLPLPDGVPNWEGAPPPDAFRALLSGGAAA